MLESPKNLHARVYRHKICINAEVLWKTFNVIKSRVNNLTTKSKYIHMNTDNAWFGG